MIWEVGGGRRRERKWSRCRRRRWRGERTLDFISSLRREERMSSSASIDIQNTRGKVKSLLITQRELQNRLQVVLPDLRELLEGGFEIGCGTCCSSDGVSSENGSENSDVFEAAVESLTVKGNCEDAGKGESEGRVSSRPDASRETNEKTTTHPSSAQHHRARHLLRMDS